jgi:hypothetical protein
VKQVAIGPDPLFADKVWMGDIVAPIRLLVGEFEKDLVIVLYQGHVGLTILAWQTAHRTGNPMITRP